MSLLKGSAFVPLLHRISSTLRAESNLHIKRACSDLLFFEDRQDTRTQTPEAGRSSAAALRPATPILTAVLLVFFSAIGVNRSSAVSLDMQLLALVPPGSEVVAGIRAPSLHGQFGNYAFITNDNRIDFADFVAITGSDESRIFNQVIYTASSGHDGKPVEHSILVSGHFDHDTIFRALSANETVIHYRGITVLDVSPFERERSYFRLRRWLAFIGSSEAIFGTVASVEAEIGRSLAGLPPDTAILQRLARLQRNNEEWSLLRDIRHGIAVLHQLRLLDPALADLAENGDSLAFGIRYGRRVEIEFGVDLTSKSDTVSSSDSRSRPSADIRKHDFLLASGPSPSSVGDRAVHRVLKLSKAQFLKWVAQASSTAH